MSLVMFASVCDRCAMRGEEYRAFPTCRECGEDVCPACSTDHDEETGSATCLRCEKDALDARIAYEAQATRSPYAHRTLTDEERDRFQADADAERADEDEPESFL